MDNGMRQKLKNIWFGMRARCNNPQASSYYQYGGRGIQVCERWNNFENFVADMGPKPYRKTLDRIDNDGNYEPQNCRWATAQEQRKNQRPHTNIIKTRQNSFLPLPFIPMKNKNIKRINISIDADQLKKVKSLDIDLHNLIRISIDHAISLVETQAWTNGPK